MSEKGQGEQGTTPVGTGTVLAGGGDGGSTSTTAPPKYEGRQPTDAEREAGRWLDEPPPKYEGRQPTDAEREAGRWLDEPGSSGSSASGSGATGGEWIADDVFVSPGGTPFEFQPTEGKPSAPGAGTAPSGGAAPETPPSQPAAPTQPKPDPLVGETDYRPPAAPATSDQSSTTESAGPAEAPPASKPNEIQGPGERRDGPGGGMTQVEPPQILPADLGDAEESGKSVLEYQDSTGLDTETPDDDQKSVLS